MVYFSPPHGRGSRNLRSREPTDLGGILRYSHLGAQFAITVALLFYVGYRLDLRYGTSPLLAVLGLALGFTAGFYSLYKGVYGRGGVDPPPDDPKN